MEISAQVLTLVIFVVSAITAALIYIIYKIRRNNKRYRNTQSLPSNFQNKILTGIVFKVNDGDGFRFYHTKNSISSNMNYSNTLKIRIAGVDAPEMSYFGKPEQKGAKEAKIFLKKLLENRKVSIKILSIDRYKRLVCRVTIEINSLFYGSEQDVASVLLKVGHACVYEGSDAVYDSKKNLYLQLEKIAKNKKLGIWKYKNYESPMEFKKRIS